MKKMVIFIIGLLMIIYGDFEIKFAGFLLLAAEGCKASPKRNFPT